jgi:hypothetical protein
MRSLLGARLVLPAMAAFPALAAPVTFAQFTSANGTNDYVFTNTGTGTATFDATSQIDFQFFPLNIPGADITQTLPVGPVAATLTRESSTSSPVTCSGSCTTVGDSFTQPVGSSTVIITDNANGEILLEITGNYSTITGQIGGNAGNFQASSTTSQLMMSSDYIDFATAAEVSRSISFTSVTQDFTVDTADNILNSFTAAGAGSFAADFTPVPEPWSLAILPIGCAGIWMFRQRRAA